MLAFDTTSLGYNVQERLIQDKKIDKRLLPSFIGEPISDLNEKAHNNPFYNALQNITFAAAAFSGGYVREAACFVAGTLVATACGLRAIETIRPGDMVLSANAETMQTDYKPVLETYVRKVDKLVHLTVNGEEIVTTVDYPFYVNGQGFVNAVDLYIGSQLIDNNGNILKVEQIFRESLHDETCDVYNFKVDEWHTYFVGDNSVLVHNADYKTDNEQYTRRINSDKLTISEGEETVTYRRVQGGNGTNSSQQRIIVNDDGRLIINNKSSDLNISIDNGEHSAYFKSLRGEDSYIVEFEVPKWFDDFIQENTINQYGYRSNPLNQNGTAPKITDTTTPGNSFELPEPWTQWIEEVAKDGKIVN